MGCQFVGGVLAQRCQRDLIVVVAAHPWRCIAGAKIHQQQETGADHGLRQNLDQRFAAGVHEVEVLEQDHGRCGRSGRACQAPEERFQPVTPGARIHAR